MIEESQDSSANAPFHHSISLKVILRHQSTTVKDMDMAGRMVAYPRHKDEVASTYLTHSIITDTPCHDQSEGAPVGGIREM